MWDEPVNAKIDEVARQMTEGSPAGGAEFRRRVLARVEAGDAPRATWRAAFVLSPLAATVLVIIAVFIVRGGNTQRAERARPLHEQAGTAPNTNGERAEQARPLREHAGTATSVEAGTAAGVGAELAPRTRAEQARPLRGQAGKTTPAFARAPSEVAAIAALTERPLDVAPLTVDALTPDRIQIERLDALTPLRVAPLDITDVQRRYE